MSVNGRIEQCRDSQSDMNNELTMQLHHYNFDIFNMFNDSNP